MFDFGVSSKAESKLPKSKLVTLLKRIFVSLEAIEAVNAETLISLLLESSENSKVILLAVRLELTSKAER